MRKSESAGWPDRHGRNGHNKSRLRHRNNNNINLKKKECEHGEPICCSAEQTTLRLSTTGQQMMTVGNVSMRVSGGNYVQLPHPHTMPLSNPHPPHSLALSLYPLQRPWWDTTFHLLIAVIGVCEGEVHVFCSPSASVRELENGILWRAVCVCLPHPRWHIFIIRSGTEQISLSSGHQHTLWFAILKVI